MFYWNVYKPPCEQIQLVFLMLRFTEVVYVVLEESYERHCSTVTEELEIKDK